MRSTVPPSATPGVAPRSGHAHRRGGQHHPATVIPAEEDMLRTGAVAGGVGPRTAMDPERDPDGREIPSRLHLAPHHPEPHRIGGEGVPDPIVLLDRGGD